MASLDLKIIFPVENLTIPTNIKGYFLLPMSFCKFGKNTLAVLLPAHSSKKLFHICHFGNASHFPNPTSTLGPPPPGVRDLLLVPNYATHISAARFFACVNFIAKSDVCLYLWFGMFQIKVIFPVKISLFRKISEHILPIYGCHFSNLESTRWPGSLGQTTLCKNLLFMFLSCFFPFHDTYLGGPPTSAGGVN